MVLPATLAAFALVAAACGDDDDDDAASATAEATGDDDRGDDSAADRGATTERPGEERRRRPRRPLKSSTAAESSTAESSTAESSAPAEVEGKVTDFAAYVGGSGPADDSLEPIKIGYFNQQGGAVEVSAHEHRRHQQRGPVHQRGGRRHRRPPARGGDLLRRQHGGGRPAVRPAVRQRRLDRRRRLRPDVHRDRVVLRRAGRLEAGDPRRVGQPGRHGAGHGRRALRRRQVHPGPVRHVRPRHAGNRRRRRWSIPKAPARTRVPPDRRRRSRRPGSRSRWCRTRPTRPT